MNNDKQQHTLEEENKGYSRRAILKLLSATGAAVGLDKLLPAAWISPQAMALEEPVPDSGDIPPIQIRNLSIHWNDSIIRDGQTWCNGSAMFEYFSLAVNVSDSTGLFAVLNSRGEFSTGDPIANIGGMVFPYNDSLVTGNISLPLPGYFPRNQMDGLAVMLRENQKPPLDSNRLAERFIPCNGPLISELKLKACTPKVKKDGVLYCTYHVGFHFIDEDNAVTQFSTLTAGHGDQVLLSNAILGHLGIYPPNPHQGMIEFDVDIPEGHAGKLRVILSNDNGDPSNVLYSDRPFISECPQKLDLLVGGSTSQLVLNSPLKYQVSFLYNDSAGILSNNSLVSARLTNGPTLLQAVPIWNAEGYVQVINNYETYINPVDNCPPSVIDGSLGTGLFHVTLPGVSILAVQTDEDLNWFLGDPNDGRTSNAELTTLGDPTAVSLQELTAEPGKTALTAAAAAAAALGAATLVTKLSQDSQSETGVDAVSQE